jgi:formylmethanofuran dehydrogenase subunit E
VYTIYSRSTRHGIRVAFLEKNVPENIREDREKFAEWVLAAPQETILSLTAVSISEPEPAEIRNSVPCSICHEAVMESRLKILEGQSVCIPCFEQHQNLKGGLNEQKAAEC